jgi:hypothetical protein
MGQETSAMNLVSFPEPERFRMTEVAPSDTLSGNPFKAAWNASLWPLGMAPTGSLFSAVDRVRSATAIWIRPSQEGIENSF